MAGLSRATFEREMKLDKLDTLLLSLSSSLSLVVTIVAALQDIRWLIHFIPILVPAWIMPIYIGYIRGALILDRLEERVRGWTYFVAGAGFYAAIYLSVFIIDPTLNIVSPTVRSAFAYSGYILAFVIIVLSIFVSRKIFGIYRRRVTLDINKAIISTTLASFFVGAFSYLVARSLVSIAENPEVWTVVPWVLILCPFFIFFIYFDGRARRLAGTNRRKMG